MAPRFPLVTSENNDNIDPQLLGQSGEGSIDPRMTTRYGMIDSLRETLNRPSPMEQDRIRDGTNYVPEEDKVPNPVDVPGTDVTPADATAATGPSRGRISKAASSARKTVKRPKRRLSDAAGSIGRSLRPRHNINPEFASRSRSRSRSPSAEEPKSESDYRERTPLAHDSGSEYADDNDTIPVRGPGLPGPRGAPAAPSNPAPAPAPPPAPAAAQRDMVATAKQALALMAAQAVLANNFQLPYDQYPETQRGRAFYCLICGVKRRHKRDMTRHHNQTHPNQNRDVVMGDI